MKRTKKIIVLLMIFCITVTLMPSMAFAEEQGEEQPVLEETQTRESEEAPAMQEESAEPEAAEVSEEQLPAEDQKEGEEPAATGEEETPEEGLPEEVVSEPETEDAAFDATRADYLSYDPLYISKYANSKYVDASEIEMTRFVNVVTAMKGMVSYNISKQSSFEVTEDNYLAGMNCEIPVYNIDDDSSYYVAVPDVNKFNGGFKMYDMEVGYNNDYAEMISGWKYEKGILYIPKSAVDHPSYRHETPENAMLAVQLNYAIGNDMDFTKSIPVQILSKDEPKNKTVHTANLFDISGLKVSTGVKGRKTSDIDVFLNGQMIPVNEGAWSYDKSSGELSIQALPGVVSSINIVFKHRNIAETVSDATVSAIEAITPKAFAAAGEASDQAGMKYFRDDTGKLVTLNINASDMFVGYRGYYDAASIHYGRENGQSHAEAEAYKKGLRGWEDSINYLYGGYTTFAGAGSSDDETYDSKVIPLWAISSYALGEDLGRADDVDNGKITATELVEHYVSDTATKKMTIYEWLWTYKDKLKQSEKETGNNKGNGIGGANNFAVTFPKTITGSETNLVDPGSPNANGNNTRVNQDITFDLNGISETSYYFAASCNELGKATAGSDGVSKKRIYVTCLGVGEDYVVLAFVHNVAGRKQSACAIYKFKTEIKPEYGEPDFRVFKTDPTGTFDYRNLLGAEFTVKYYNVANKADIASASPERWWTFVTTQKDAPSGAPAGTYWAGFDWRTDAKIAGGEFYTDGNKRVMPLGWFTIEETKAPSGFKITSTKYYGHVYQNGGSVVTDLEGANADGKLNVETFVFTDEPYKTTIHKKNSATGGELAGAQLQILKGSAVIVPTWTTTTTPKVVEGLSAGTYTLREVKAPYGYDLAADVTFTVTGTSDQTVNMSNSPVTVGTTALDDTTKKHVGSRKTSSKITDTVHMTGLVKDRKYRLTGTLMNKRTGAAVSGVTVSPKEFTATAATMDVTMDFTFNSAALPEGDSVVVYETLYRTSSVNGDTVPVEIQKHQDINDTAQTISYPGISTMAVDPASTTQNLLAGPGATIRDTVTYKGLLAGETYTLEGELYDKTAGKLTGIKQTASFKASAESGTATMDFTFDGTSYEGHTMVVYETLKLGTTELVDHRNPGDAAQTIYLPKVRTTISDAKTKDRLSNAAETVTLNDEVVCENLIVGRTYTISGKLVYRDSGNDVLDNGHTVTAETEPFVASATTMTKVLTFRFNGSLLEGKTVVAFEDLTTERKKVGTHADLTDEAQNDHIPKIRTIAAISDDKHVFTDTINYQNLLPGRKYVFRGWLVDTATGKKIPDSDGKVELTVTNANINGSVNMTMNTAKYDDMYGHSMTAFEELYVIESIDGKDTEVIVADHKDRTGDESTNPQTKEIYHDLRVQKNVTGNLGDLTKIFEYTVEFTDLVPGMTYTVEGDDAKTFKAGNDGKATLELRLADDQVATIRQLPKSATYKVTEAASDHVAQYRMLSEDMADKGAKIQVKEANNGSEAARILATAVETVDLFDGTVVVIWENNRDLATLTAVPSYLNIWLASFGAVLAAALILVIRKVRVDRAEDNEI